MTWWVKSINYLWVLSYHIEQPNLLIIPISSLLPVCLCMCNASPSCFGIDRVVTWDIRSCAILRTCFFSFLVRLTLPFYGSTCSLEFVIIHAVQWRLFIKQSQRRFLVLSLCILYSFGKNLLWTCFLSHGIIIHNKFYGFWAFTLSFNSCLTCLGTECIWIILRHENPSVISVIIVRHQQKFIDLLFAILMLKKTFHWL